MPDSVARTTVKKFDIFSLPFQFNLGAEKEKRTFVGGLLSLIILCLSIAYFVYLCYLYFGNKIQPSIATTNEYSQETFPMEFTSGFIAVKILMYNGQTLADFQRDKGKVYLNLISVYDTSGQKNPLSPTMMIPCQEEHLKEYMCLDVKTLSKGNDSVKLNFTPNDIEKETISILMAVCDQTVAPPGVICEDETVIRNTLISFATKISVRVQLKQFNTKLKEFEERIKEETYYFDTSLAFYSKYNFQKTDVGISEGFLIQNINESRFFSDLFRKDMSVTQTLIKDQLGFKILGGILLFVGQESISMEIQYAQFTTLLAQFTSVFNSLLFIGVISKFFAQSEILQQFAELQLKVYFKKSAILILKELGFSNGLNEAKKEGIVNFWNYVKGMDIKNVGQHIKIGILKKLKIVFSDEEAQKEKEDTAQIKVFKQLIGQSNKAFNIFEIQKEILQLKIQMRLLLSVEQYAAMQLCGSRLVVPSEKKQNESQQVQIENKEEDDKSLKIKSGRELLSFQQPPFQHSRSSSVYPLQASQQQQQQDEKQVYIQGEKQVYIQEEKQVSIPEDQIEEEPLSHLEKIDMIEKDEEFFQTCINKFLINNQQSNEIDKRILECMVGKTEDNLNP